MRTLQFEFEDEQHTHKGQERTVKKKKKVVVSVLGGRLQRWVFSCGTLWGVGLPLFLLWHINLVVLVLTSPDAEL